MGRRNKAYSKDLHQQAYDRLTGMQAFGKSKKEAVANGTDKEKIFSFNTYKSYWKHTKYFIEYIKSEHPECTTLKSAKKYVNEWLQVRADQGLSAWTVQLEAKAMGKLYGISPDDKDYFQPPKRNRADIKRSRGDRVRDRHFSITNNDELIKFCKGTGLRRSELGALKGGDLLTKGEIEAEAAQLEAVPDQKRTPEEVRRLEVLKDTRLFDSEYYAVSYTHLDVYKRQSIMYLSVTERAAGSVLVPLSEKMRNRLWNGFRTLQTEKRYGSTSTSVQIYMHTGLNMQRIFTGSMRDR